MINWKELKIGDKLNEIIDEFDCVKPYKVPCVVTEVAEDHAIAEEICDKGKPMHLWIDEDTADLFEKMELTKADFEKIIRYTSVAWRGFFTEEELQENTENIYADYLASKRDKYVNDTMQVMCENMAEDMDYYECEDYADCDNILGKDIEAMEKVLNDYMDFMKR